MFKGNISLFLNYNFAIYIYIYSVRIPQEPREISSNIYIYSRYDEQVGLKIT